jgi:integrase
VADGISSRHFVLWELLWEISMGKLSAKQVQGLRDPGKYGDGDGLMLDVKAPDRRYWTYRFTLGGQARTMTFGNADRVSLTQARHAAAKARGMVKAGVDPLAEKARVRALREAQAAETARLVSFAQAMDAYLRAHAAGWRGRRTVKQWRNMLRDYAAPAFGAKPVAEVTADDVLRCLSPIWSCRSVTASILRNRIELVIDYAQARGWRAEGENPARWKGGMKRLLPSPTRVHTTTHRPALGWREAPDLMARLATETTMAARCLRFVVLTAGRSGEARGCRWDEIDMANAVWTIPGARMKGGKEHRVPLSEPAMDILRALPRIDSDLVFFGRSGHQPLTDTTLRALLLRLAPGITVHGFRSTFRDWCADTGKPGDLAEAALAHVSGNQVQRAYQRSDLLDARRGLMVAWADYLTKPAEVVRLAA